MARIQGNKIIRDHSNSNRPVVSCTTFGWIVYGALPSSQRIADNLERLWRVDAVKEKSLLTSEEARCEQIFSETIKRAEDGRYSVAMPIMDNPPKLGNSLRAAIARQLQNERRFRKDPRLKENYIKDIRQFIDLDHMELVPLNEIDKEDVYYIPHHAANSSKFRVVFDGSVKTTTGLSLNDILLNGPRCQDDLNIIIMRFRKYGVALTTDITKMYRQVLVPENQRDYLRIVWRENENEPLRHYRMKRQTYGLKSSAYCCVATLRYCALEHRHKYPLASKAVLNSFYVDDGTLCADTDLDAEKLYQELNEMLMSCGFPLAKWATNSAHMRSVLGVTAGAVSSVNFDLCDESSILGLKWSIADDAFRYNYTNLSDLPPTKRNIVSAIAKLYDPIGWLAPIVILGEILIQDVWKSKVEWDTIVPLELKNRWNDLKRTMIDVNKITVPRWIGLSPEKSIEIHGFSDASNSAYGMTFYARVESGITIECNLITSKTRVAPLKGMTIPRMELCGALMMAHMCQQICSIHDVPMSKLTLWTDSSIVIHWLSKCPSGLKAFVGNRVAEAQECTKGAQWKHVRTNDNPADLASRGLFASELVGNSLWFHGPHWLSKPHSDWPVGSFTIDQRVKEATVAESRAVQACAIIRVETVPRIEVTVNDVTTEMLLDHCSSMMRLVRVTARVLAFIRKIRTKEKVCSTFIAHADYLEAQAIWIKYHQQKYFAGDIELLKNGKSLSRDSIIVKMSPL
ncbi:uncharacterized protein LOC116348558 [Contarinia nasturtii]|uniref:uncharacterized protein LOC116348558 n=1 Tax=Contarinia nasturtii TaxID=265458 RepID=UPI0012D46184|nr:uncharacterized protein LOC116348558 [Contarinia nasturtii]